MLVGLLADFQAVGAILPAGLLAALGGINGYFEQGLAWALFIGSGIFVFVSLGTILLRENHRANRLQHKLVVTGVNMQQIALASGSVLFRPNFFLQNDAGFELFFDVVEADYSFGPVKGSLDKTVPLRGLLSAKSGTGILVPAAEGVPPLTTGRVKIRVRYGREKDSYTHQLDTTLECNTLTVLPAAETGVMDMTRLVQSLEYERTKD